jgi:lysophospholipase L1-like esterase
MKLNIVRHPISFNGPATAAMTALALFLGLALSIRAQTNQPGEFDRGQQGTNALTRSTNAPGARGARGPVVQAHSPRDDAGNWTPTDWSKADSKLPTLVIAGDSTAAPGDPNHRGWGAVLVDYFDTSKINVVNRSRGGRSFRTFVEEKLWDQILANLKPGDIVMIQLGQNDGGSVLAANRRPDLPGAGNEMQEVPRADGTLEPVYTYGWYTRKFIRDAKEKRAVPVVMSMTANNSWTNTVVRRNYGQFYQLSKQIAGEEKVLFLDHTSIIADHWDALGAAAVKIFFPADFVHTSTDGAVQNAEMFIAGVKAMGLKPLIDDLNEKGNAIAPYKLAVTTQN